MEEIDEFLSTSDEYFNQTVQYWFFLFESPNKPRTSESFLRLVSALRDIYFFTIENYNKPFKCITKIDDICKENEFSKDDKLLLIDKLLSMLSIFEEEKHIMVYLQILNHRNDIEPILIDKDFIKSQYKFAFDNIKNEMIKHNTIEEKIKYLIRTMLDFDQSLPSMDALEYEFYESTAVVHLVKVELQKLQFELSALTNNAKPKDQKDVKPFAEFLLHSNPVAFAEKLKVEFGSEQSKAIRLMLEVLKSHEPPLIAYSNKQQLFNSLEAFFGKSIGSKQSIMDINILPAHDVDLKAFKDRLDHLLKSMKE